MNQIGFTKNGLLLLMYTQLIILFVVCMPICSTGIVKREIQSRNTTKLIWEPINVVNNTLDDNVTTTASSETASSTTTVTSETASSTTNVTSEITSSTTTTIIPRIQRRPIESRIPSTPQTSTTTENPASQFTTEKYAKILPKENITVQASENNSQPVNDQNNLDDDAEVINLSDFEGTTTEEHHFDLSRYTSDYNGNDNEQNDFNETHQQLVNDNESDGDEQMSTYHVDYNLKGMILTTPETLYFDEKHKEYEKENFARFQDDGDRFNFTATMNNADSEDRRYRSDLVLNDIHGNSTEERKQSIYLNEAEVESSNYDTSSSEIKNNTIGGEKRAKFMQEGSHVNLTIPNAPEVWALASLKNVEHTKSKEGQFYNVTEVDEETNHASNGTLVTKQLADWVEVMKNNDFTSSSYMGNNTSEVTNNPSQETNNPSQVTNNPSQETNNPPQETNNPSQEVNNPSEEINNPSHETDNSPQETNYATTSIPDSITKSSASRGKVKFQTKPLIFSDQDSASQENQIIAVRLTTLPPPIVVIRNNTKANQLSHSILSNDSENKVNSKELSNSSPISDVLGATETVTENEETTTTTMQSEIIHDVDNSQNELETKFVHSRNSTEKPTTTEKEFESTTENRFEHTTEVEESTPIDDSESERENEIRTTTPLTETTTVTVTNEPEGKTVSATTEMEVPTTNLVNLETESNSEVDEDQTDHSIYVYSTTSAKDSTASTENEILQTQSSTLQPQNMDIQKTTELKYPESETIIKTEDLFRPNTEIITQTEDKSVTYEVVPDEKQVLETTVTNVNRSANVYTTIKNPSDEATTSDTHLADAIPEVIEDFTPRQEFPTTDEQVPGIDEPDTNAIIAISISVVGVIILGAGLVVMYVMRKRRKQLSYGQRCRPVGMDAYSLDNVSVYNSVRRKGILRASKRSYGNAAFDDPGLKNNLLTGAALVAFAQKRNEIYEEFKELPSVTARAEEVPAGCEDKNRYANIIPLPESRVFLKRIGDDDKSEYINANYVKGPKDNSHYYIACQAPLESTITDFWRMIWEQNSRVIIMATDLIENGIEQCAEYLPPSFVIDNHVTFGDFHITLKNREVKDKYAMSMVHIKNTNTNTWREITHFWYQWPDTGVPTEQASLIGLLLEARGYLRVSSSEQMDNNENSQSNNDNLNHENGSVDKSKSLLRTQGPLTVHCSPGTGRTGTIIACDIALRALEQPTRSVDIPQIVYFVRRGRASAVRTREQYEFIYKVANVYAAKLTGPITEN